MRVLVATDKFKGTMTARAACEVIERGLSTVMRNSKVRRMPLADGGEGTIEVLAGREGGSAIVEVASTSGMLKQRDALAASSAATGTALAEVFAHQPDRILVAIGGSSSTDGGAGIATTLGWRFLDSAGEELAPGGGALRDLVSIDGDRARRSPAPIVGLCDVANPLLGATGSARLFAPQKGASPQEVELLEVGLAVLADVIREQLGVDVADLPGAGAGGGIGAGLVAFFGARLVDGFSFIAESIGLEPAIAEADIVVTGEGCLDEGSLSGKVTSGVARLALELDVPVVAACGQITLSDLQMKELGFASWEDAPSAPDTTPEESLEAAARRLAERIGL